MMKIEAAARLEAHAIEACLTAFRDDRIPLNAALPESVFDHFKPADWKKLAEMLAEVNKWFLGHYMGAKKGSEIPKCLNGLMVLNNIWEFKAPKGPYYRAFPVIEEKARASPEGTESKLRVVHRRLSSWTNSLPAAVKFTTDVGARNLPWDHIQIIVQANGVEKYAVVSYDHLTKVVAPRLLLVLRRFKDKTRSMSDDTYRDLLAFTGFGDSLWKTQKEIVCFLPDTTYPVTVVYNPVKPEVKVRKRKIRT